ncbi:hypothetical protein JCM5350_005492 [Sporobolomyces pararoseus]
MNSLPPELLSSIIELAADCTSVYESWDTRMDTLLSLTLVNKTFQNIAQLLIPEKFFFKEDDDVVGEPFEKFMRSEVTTNIKSLAFEPKLEAYCYKLPILFGFENLTELRVKCCGDMSLQTFKAHRRTLQSVFAALRRNLAERSFSIETILTDLSRLTLYDGYFHYDPETDSNIALPSLVELTLENTSLVMHESFRAGAICSLLSESHFPSLQALGTKGIRGCSFEDGLDTEPVFTDSLITQLECLMTDKVPIRTATLNLPIPVPFLFDIRAEEELKEDFRSSIEFALPSPAHNHLRLRLPSEPDSSHEDTESALEFAYKVVKESTSLEELYLDLYPRDGRRGYVSEKELAEKMKKLEEIAREKNVEIIWENHEDDWCRSRVSKEFWRRCKEKKEKPQAK